MSANTTQLPDVSFKRASAPCMDNTTFHFCNRNAQGLPVRIFVSLLVFVFCISIPASSQAQLLLGTSASEINFRQGPGAGHKVLHTVNASNLLVILPRESQNGFIEAFDVETSSSGFVYENLIRITDTLHYAKQNFFEYSGESATGDIEIELINRTSHTLFVWINKFSYTIGPNEKKVLILDNDEITYFSSAPGLFPVFGKEILQKGNVYKWKFSL